MILQKNEVVLRGLIGSLLHLEPDEIVSVRIRNPIQLGEQIDNKTYILDIHVKLNDDTFVDLEMQVVNLGNWTDRSLSYLCRLFDNLYHGQNYQKSKNAIHIGILDYTLFPEFSEFYASYKLLNVKNHHLFSDKFILNVLNLKKAELATEEDRLYQIDQWAKLFKARTWEKLRMIAEKNECMSEAAETLYEMNADEIVQEQCLAREEYYRHEAMVQQQLEEQRQVLEEKDKRIAQLEELIRQNQS